MGKCNGTMRSVDCLACLSWHGLDTHPSQISRAHFRWLSARATFFQKLEYQSRDIGWKLCRNEIAWKSMYGRFVRFNCRAEDHRRCIYIDSTPFFILHVCPTAHHGRFWRTTCRTMTRAIKPILVRQTVKCWPRTKSNKLNVRRIIMSIWMNDEVMMMFAWWCLLCYVTNGVLCLL